MPRLEVDPAGSHGFGLCQSMADEEVCAWPDAAEMWMRDIGALRAPGGAPRPPLGAARRPASMPLGPLPASPLCSTLPSVPLRTMCFSFTARALREPPRHPLTRVTRPLGGRLARGSWRGPRLLRRRLPPPHLLMTRTQRARPPLSTRPAPRAPEARGCCMRHRRRRHRHIHATWHAAWIPPAARRAPLLPCLTRATTRRARSPCPHTPAAPNSLSVGAFARPGG